MCPCTKLGDSIKLIYFVINVINPLMGDLLIIGGATLYGVCNVCEAS